MDLQILKEMDKEVRYLQQEFVRLKVPLFKVSNDPNDLKLQQKVLFILQDIWANNKSEFMLYVWTQNHWGHLVTFLATLFFSFLVFFFIQPLLHTLSRYH